MYQNTQSANISPKTVLIGLDEYKITMVIMANIITVLEEAKKYFEETNTNPSWLKLYNEAMDINTKHIQLKVT